MSEELLLLDARRSAGLLGISRALFYRLHASGELGSAPVRLGGAVRWRKAELLDWVCAVARAVDMAEKKCAMNPPTPGCCGPDAELLNRPVKLRRSRPRCSKCGRFTRENDLTGWDGHGRWWCERCAVAADHKRGPKRRKGIVDREFDRLSRTPRRSIGLSGTFGGPVDVPT